LKKDDTDNGSLWGDTMTATIERKGEWLPNIAWDITDDGAEKPNAGGCPKVQLTAKGGQ
jgi:hypothetical protein